MRTTILTLAAGLAHLVAGAINITTTNDVDLEAGTGDLGWGASGLPFGYSAGSGLDFDEGNPPSLPRLQPVSHCFASSSFIPCQRSR